tara:strand:- start:320 stop:1492 length:1173 start_codon:yes stop_codon:yes gene_type:complete
MIKKIIYIILFLSICIQLKSQDVSFSQFDLNMLYMNPALAGFEQNNRTLIARRNQWVGISEKFNSNIVEFNLSKNIKKRRISGGEIDWTGGIYLMENTANTVLKSYHIGIVPWTFHFQLPKSFYISMGLQNTLRFNTIDWSQLVFSDQINEYNDDVTASNAELPAFENQNSFLDPSFGFILTKHSNLNKKSSNTSFIGFAWHHLYPPIESFYNDQSKIPRIPQKFTFHGQFISSFNDVVSKAFNFWKVSYKHTKQGSNATQKDDMGVSLSLANKIQLEGGLFYRISRRKLENEEKVSLMNESIIPTLKIRMGVGQDIGMELSYSYDYNFSRLNNSNAVATNEIALSFYYLKNNDRICPAQGKWGNNRKWENVMLNRKGYGSKNKKNRWIW